MGKHNLFFYAIFNKSQFVLGLKDEVGNGLGLLMVGVTPLGSWIVQSYELGYVYAIAFFFLSLDIDRGDTIFVWFDNWYTWVMLPLIFILVLLETN